MIELEDLTYAYPESPPVFTNFCWKIERGEAWAVLGPSGCGKTTLLYLLAGLRFPQSGRVLVGRQALTRPRPRTGLILQDYGLLPWATVTQNAELGVRIRNYYGPDGTHAPEDHHSPNAVSSWLERLGLVEGAGKYPGRISGGQRQRTAIARTLALDPDLLLMDEPFSSLDAPTREGLQSLTLELVEEQDLTLVIVTHAIEEAVYMGKKILLLDNPPNVEPLVIRNLKSGHPNFRDSTDYTKLCRHLRNLMEKT